TSEVPTANGGVAAYLSLDAENDAALANGRAALDRLQEQLDTYGDSLFSDDPQTVKNQTMHFAHDVDHAIGYDPDKQSETGISLASGDDVPCIQLFSAAGKRADLICPEKGSLQLNYVEREPVAPGQPIEKAAIYSGWGVPFTRINSHDFTPPSQKAQP